MYLLHPFAKDSECSAAEVAGQHRVQLAMSAQKATGIDAAQIGHIRISRLVPVLVFF